jgi:hypothetical protein
MEALYDYLQAEKKEVQGYSTAGLRIWFFENHYVQANMFNSSRYRLLSISSNMRKFQ